jgi:hypothetical protein
MSDWMREVSRHSMRYYRCAREGRSVGEREREREREVGSKLCKRVWADLVEPVGEVLVKKGVVDGRTERVGERERRRETSRESVRW